MILKRYVVILLLIAPTASGIGQGFLRASGTKIVKGTGEEILLRGIGLGGWLVPEGYMLHLDTSMNSYSKIRSAVAALIGEANTDQFFQLYRANYVRRKDIDQIALWGFNSIRLPMHYVLLTPKDQPGVYLETGFALIDSLLAWCEANRLYLILDLHCAPGGQNKDNISDYGGYPSLWESTEYQQRTVDLWKKIAERYATKEWIGGYDLLNETAFDLGAGNAPLRALFITMTNAIRQVDTNHLIFVEGNWYATDFSGLSPAWDANMAYSFHKYWNGNTVGAIQYLLDLRVNTNRPLWLGESGENSNAWFTDCVRLMETNNIGWSWWPHKKVESIAGPLSAIKNPEYDYLLQYWRGEVPKPTVTYAVAALNQLATNLDIDRCLFHPDVIDALFRQPGTTALKAYTTHVIPGIVYAADYDMGVIQSAYNDADYQNTGSNGTWNQGWAYRNDGVDIEPCSDIPSNGYDVGWTATGEFLNFTIAVPDPGTYTLNARVAGGAAGGKMLFRIDGQIVNSFVDVPMTGGWQNWETIDCGTVTLTAGSHVFNSSFFFGGFNVNYFELTKPPTSVFAADAIPAVLSLSQNYPNPFNPSTVVSFTVPRTGRVALTVIDLLGRTVAVLFDGQAVAGRAYMAALNASRLPSGMYLARLSFDGSQIVRKMLLTK